MIGDKLLFKPEHTRKAEEIYSYIIDRRKVDERLVVSIGGCSGTGKTEVSMLLQDMLYDTDLTSLLISLDDYYLSHWRFRDQIRKNTGIVGYREVDWDLLDMLIGDFRTIAPSLHIQRVNKYIQNYENVNMINNIDFLLIEGIYGLYVNADIKVLLEGTPEQTRAFRMERGKEPETDDRREVVQREYEDIETVRGEADLIVGW